VNSPSSQIFTSIASDLSWMRGMHPGHFVELVVYGKRMVGRILKIAPDNFTIRIPIEQQSGDVRRFSVTGTAVISLEDSAARVPVSAQSTGEYVRLQFIGPAEIIQRRRHVRVLVALPVKLCWQTEPNGPWSFVESTSEDLSMGGLRVAPAKTVWPSAGEQVTVAIELPQGAIEEKATVIGKTPAYGLRLSFVGLRAQARIWLESLLESEGS
jgi:c-di-GMP-binding flagellar brake protein YcgR